MNLSSSTLLDVDEDPSFGPENSFDTDTDISQVNNESIDIVTERKFVVSENQLDQLLNKMLCPESADNSIYASKTVSGTNIGVKMLCSNGDVFDWCGQPKVGKLFAFNLLLCSSIVFSGTKFIE